MPEEPDKSKIENLRNILYSRKVKIKPNFVLDLNKHNPEVGDDWQKDTENSSKANTVEANDVASTNFSKKIFFLAFVFFIVSLCIAGYVYLKGGNIISASNIKIDVVGPTTAKAGEETVLDVSITNNNDTTLEIADLVLEYPPGTRSATDAVTLMTHDRVAFDNIAPHTTVRRTIKSILYGEEGSTAHIDMTLEYRVSTAMSVFTKDSSYEVQIGSSPLTLSVEGLKEVNANQEYSLNIKVVSNSEAVVKDVVLTADLPFGYDVSSYNPRPEPDTTSWNLGDIESKGERNIVIKGKMYGDHNEDRYFKINVGTKDPKISNQISGVISSITQQVTIREPFVGVALTFDRNNTDTTNYIAKSGSTINGVINLVNNLDVPIYDVVVEAKASGAILLDDSEKAPAGFYDSNTGVIRWNKLYDKDLSNILPGNNTDQVFSISTMKSAVSDTAKLNNPTFVVDITVRAKRRLESGVPEDIVSTIRKTIKVETDAYFTSQITHNTGPIENEGSLPPKVGKNTDYTVTWAVTNTFNPISGAKVTAVLPDYVSWKDVVVGQGEKVMFNPESREVAWDLGGVNAQSGGKPSLRRVSFQIGFIPSQSQVQSVPTLVNVANFSAHDTFTGTDISGQNQVLTTELPTDPLYVYSDSQVQP